MGAFILEYGEPGTLRKEIHTGRYISSIKTNAPQETVVISTNKILRNPKPSQSSVNDIDKLMRKPNFEGIPELLEIVSNKKNYKLLNPADLYQILGYLPTIGHISKSCIKLRDTIGVILEAKRKIPGVR